jgi:hypothetical protein
MFEIQKSECAESIQFGLGLTKKWRDKMTARYPFDGRNARAALCLAKLANEAGQLGDKDYLQLQPYFESSGEPWRAAISAAGRAVGFKRRIKDLPTFVEHLIEVLDEPVAVS